MDPRQSTFGKILREKRIGRGLTQRELAELASVDDSYISQLERDYKFPSSRTVESLARALNVEVAELLAMYFPAAETRAREVFVGRQDAVDAFDRCLDERADFLVVGGGPGIGKTALLVDKFAATCRDRRIAHLNFDCRRISSYRDFLKELRDAFPSRPGAYHDFDEIYGQCRAIERRLRSRFKDPFSVQVTTAGPEEAAGAGVELSYAEKYVYRDAERLLTDELLTRWTSSFARSVGRAVILLDDFHLLSATVAYWLGRFLERLADAGILGESILVVATVAGAGSFSPPGAARSVRRLELGPFTPAEVEEYVVARGLDLTEDEWEAVRVLDGDVRSLKFWADYAEAAAAYRENRLGLAEEGLRRLDEEISPYLESGGVKNGVLLGMKTQWTLGHLTRLQGRLEEAATYYRGAAALAEGLQEVPPAELGYLYLDLGHVYRHRGRWDQAVEYYVLGNGVLEGRGDRLGSGIAHSGLGTAYRLQGKSARSKQEYRRAAELLGTCLKDERRGAEARRWLASTLSNEAITLRLEAERTMAAGEKVAARKTLARAKQLCEEALAVCADPAETAVAENRFGLCLLTESRWLRAGGAEAEAGELLAAAVRQHKRALATFEDLGDKYRVAQVLADLGVAAAEQGLVHDAIIDFKNSLALFQQMGSRYHGAKVLVELGLLSEGEEQLSYFAEALTSAREHNAESLAEIADAVKDALAAGDDARARRFYDEQVARDPRLKGVLAT